MDIMPTILDLAGITHPAATCNGREMAAYRDRQVFRMTGHSWVHYFTNKTTGDQQLDRGDQGIYGDDEFMGWELHGMASLRKGKWKIVWLGDQQPTGKDAWELFNLEHDPGEVHDRAKEMPDKVKELSTLFDQSVFLPLHRMTILSYTV